MENLKKHKEIVIIFLILGITFYWFQVRPAQIKKSCSLVTEIKEAITKEQAEINKVELKEACEKYPNYCTILGIETEERPQKIEVHEASDKEYNQCLRQHGL